MRKTVKAGRRGVEKPGARKEMVQTPGEVIPKGGGLKMPRRDRATR